MNTPAPSQSGPQSGPQGRPRSGTLVARVAAALRADIVAGTVQPGDRLPSEGQLTQAHGVSRTVVREAIAALRSEGLVEARQGAGVFVLAPEPQAPPPFRNLDPQRISSTIELLELRTAVEVEAAGLAAQRHTPAGDEAILQANARFQACVADGEPTGDADYHLHLVIAEMTGNPRFGEFLQVIGPGIIPRRALRPDEAADPAPKGYLEQIRAEHDRIVAAILDSDEIAAREAMRVHLKGSQTRYRSLLRQ
ncbi:FadR/GntR family transcriptional regulator [Frigidibacter sp. MR17.24]|uniref:FadR/GntR family transcriptional regulator n=1 Tax=Frigidibacter sp. MR17.24 TaxID=3127345 RepID=UPI0030129DDC